MKQILIISLLLVAFNSYAKFYPGTLTFENGKSREGFIDSNLGDVILFKGWMEAQPEEISAKSIKTVWIKTNGGHKLNEYRYLPVDMSSDKAISRMWVRLVEKGIVNLFVYEIIMEQDGSDKAQPLYYYCLREGQEVAKLIASRGSAQFFNVKASQFFADKPLLVEMIQNKTYTWDNIQQLVFTYNHSMQESGN